MARLRVSLLVMLICLSGCSWFHTNSWFHAKKPLPPEPPELTITGAPAGSILFIDGVQTGQPNEAGARAQVLEVAPGTHILEVRTGNAAVYRENFDAVVGEKLVITVLSGRVDTR